MATCKSCGAEIIWIKTRNGESHPVDANPEKRWVEISISEIVEPGAIFGVEDFDRKWVLLNAYTTHFATCPQSKEWSGKGASNRK